MLSPLLHSTYTIFPQTVNIAWEGCRGTELQGTCVAIFLWRHPEITGNYEYCIYRITVPGNFAHDCCFGEDS